MVQSKLKLCVLKGSTLKGISMDYGDNHEPDLSLSDLL